MNQHLILSDENDSKKVGQALARLHITGSVWLEGDLGAGKTTLTRYWLEALGHTGNVKSPTYTLVEPYFINNQHIYHVDLYRLQDSEELDYIGFDEYFDNKSLVIIEWPSRALDRLPFPILKLQLQHINNNQRKLIIQLTNDIIPDITL